MKRNRIVITGLGVASAYGNDVKTYYDSLLQGKSCVKKITDFPVEDFPTRIAGFIDQFDPEDYLSKKQARRVDPFIAYAMVAGKKALEDASLSEEGACDPSRIGVVIGSGMGGMSAFYDGVETILKKGHKRLTPFFVPFIITNMAGALLAIEKGFKGPNFSVSTACATSNYAIYSAAQEILNGNADIMICGGSEAPMNPIGLAGFVAAKTLSTRNDEPEKASRPWDRNRDGFVMGEGGAVLILERLEHALARKAPIYGEYLGGTVNCDAYHMTDPREDGFVVADCIRNAVKDAGISLLDVNYINAHATATNAGDLCEIRAIKNAFGNHVKDMKMNATKSMTGHCLGAAGGMEAIAAMMAIKTNKIHPTINLENPEPELDGIDVVKDQAQDFTVNAAISNSFGFGGHNAVLVFAPYKG